MSRLDIYKKQAKQLVRWHREGNHSIGGRIRGLARYRTVTDRQALALAFPLREAQEIIALEAGYASWAALKVAVANEATQTKPEIADTSTHARRAGDLRCQCGGVRRVFQEHSRFLDRFPAWGTTVLWLRVARRCVCASQVRARAVLAVGAQDRDGFITAFIEVENVKALYAEYVTAGAMFGQKLKKQAWGGRDFVVRDPDGNGICFVGPAA